MGGLWDFLDGFSSEGVYAETKIENLERTERKILSLSRSVSNSYPLCLKALYSSPVSHACRESALAAPQTLPAFTPAQYWSFRKDHPKLPGFHGDPT